MMMMASLYKDSYINVKEMMMSSLYKDSYINVKEMMMMASL
jgi:hypothetical protein